MILADAEFGLLIGEFSFALTIAIVSAWLGYLVGRWHQQRVDKEQKAMQKCATAKARAEQVG